MNRVGINFHGERTDRQTDNEWVARAARDEEEVRRLCSRRSN